MGFLFETCKESLLYDVWKNKNQVAESYIVYILTSGPKEQFARSGLNLEGNN